jgi:hypothetical protein
MEPYRPPEAAIDAGATGPSPLRRLLPFALLPLFMLGACITWYLGMALMNQLPAVDGARWLKRLVLILGSVGWSLCTVAPWWWPLAWAYRRHAALAGVAVGLAPVLVRSSYGPLLLDHALGIATLLIETVGIVLAISLGAHLVWRRLRTRSSP